MKVLSSGFRYECGFLVLGVGAGVRFGKTGQDCLHASTVSGDELRVQIRQVDTEATLRKRSYSKQEAKSV